MDYPKFIVIALLVLELGSNLWGRVRYGSWTGGSLQGRVGGTFGEVLVPMGVASSRLVKVIELSPNDSESLVGIVITSKGPLSLNWTYYRLPKDQARELSRLLALAAA